MKPSCSSYRRHGARRLLSCWGTSPTLTSAGKVAWQAIGNPGDSWIHSLDTEDNFLSQVIDSHARGDAILDLLVTNASELIGDIKTGGSLGFSDHTLVELAVVVV